MALSNQMVNVFMCRHPRESALSLSVLQNPLMMLGLVVEFGLLTLPLVMLSRRSRRKLNVIAGFMCAPLRLPQGL